MPNGQKYEEWLKSREEGQGAVMSTKCENALGHWRRSGGR
jgi:hypothetical protein